MKINIRHISFILLVFVSISYVSFRALNKSYYTPQRIAGRIQELFSRQVDFQEVLKDRIQQELLPQLEVSNFELNRYSSWTDLYNSSKTGVFIYKNGRLVFWNNSDIAIETRYIYNVYTNPIIHKKRGWYTSSVFDKDEYKIVLLTALQTDKALPSESPALRFSESQKIPPEVEIHPIGYKNAYGEVFPLLNEEGSEVAAIYIPLSFTSGDLGLENFLLGFIGYCVFFIGYAFQPVFKTPLRQGLYTLFFLMISAAFRYLDSMYNISGKNYGVGLFDSSLYASGMVFPSLGDLFNWALVYLGWAGMYALYLWRFGRKKYRIYFSRHPWVWVVAGTVSALSIFPLSYVIHDLIQNSIILLDINYLTSFDRNSIAALGVIFFALIAFFLISISSIYFLVQTNGRFTFFLIGALATVITVWVVGRFPVYENMVVLVFAALVVAYTHKTWEGKINLPVSYHPFLYSFASSVLLGMLLLHAVQAKRSEEMKYYASKILYQYDPAAEYFFQQSVQSFEKDTILISSISLAQQPDPELVENILAEHFRGYWLNYSITPYLFYNGAENNLDDNGHTKEGLEHIFSQGAMSGTSGFVSLSSDSALATYMGRIELYDSSGTGAGTLFLIFEGRSFMRSVGLPEFLIKRPYQLEILQKGFQSARYVNNRLEERTEQFLFPPVLKPEIIRNELASNTNRFYYLQNGSNKVIILDGNRYFVSLLNYVSMLFLISVGFAGIFQISVMAFRPSARILSLGGKFRLFILTAISLAFIAILANSLYFTRNMLSTFDNKGLHMTSENVKKELDFFFNSPSYRVSPDSVPQIERKLRRVSEAFRVDVNYFDSTGVLMASTRPELYANQLRNQLMDPRAYQALRYGYRNMYNMDEAIGDVGFISSFSPVVNSAGRTVGYFQVPYFAQNAQREADVSESLGIVLRYYAVIISIVFIVALIATNRFTQPLQELRRKISSLRLGERYDPIEYSGSDEIASLVKAYNVAVADLENSANLLAQSEREKAWREMAKQVAHEIKNPLTPMKLNVQLLERSYLDGKPDFPERLSQFTKSMLEQIDVMARIASDFSHFAKWSNERNEKFDAGVVLKSVASIFDGYMPNIRVRVQLPKTAMWVYGDKDHLLRAFNNLVKNACQAIGEQPDGFIEITAEQSERQWKICIQDNGAGIPADVRENIFKPNFTTKTTGSGLGLAMCKNIIEQFGGRIYFETTDTEGTSFFVEIPSA